MAVILPILGVSALFVFAWVICAASSDDLDDYEDIENI